MSESSIPTKIISYGSKGSHIYSNPSYPIVATGTSKEVGYYLKLDILGNANVGALLNLLLPGIRPIVIIPYLVVMESVG